MRIADFSFELPNELIAQRPASPRDSARLLVYDRKSKVITDDIFRNITNYLPAETTLVLNRAKVDKCRLRFGKYEVFLLETVNHKTAVAMVRPGKKFKHGTTITLAEGVEAEVIDINGEGHRTLRFSLALDDPKFERYKLTPLPPYIAQDESLADEYQTVFAKDAGSKAAPTAGLHFTPELLSTIRKHWPIAEVTLDVGLGTFAPISDSEVKKRQLHQETYHFDAKTSKQLQNAKHRTAVGTTTVRVLESAYASDFKPTDHSSTNIFIQPGDTLHATEALITNFHLPSTSLLMLVATFTGRDELLRIYQHAIEQKYRFYSFGDAMLVI